jgi:HEAT repeat protein
MAAISALARFPGQRESVAEQLLPLLEDADPGVRRAVAASFGRLGVRTESVRSALRCAASSSDASLRRAAEHSLSQLTAAAAGNRSAFDE